MRDSLITQPPIRLNSLNRRSIKNIKHNQGVILFISLMFMLVSTLIGISALRANISNEKMTSNNLDREIALELAEAALLEGEAVVKNSNKQIIEAVWDESLYVPKPTKNNDPTYHSGATTAASTCSAKINNIGGLCVPIEYSLAITAFLLQGQNGTLPYPPEQWVDITNNSDSSNVWSTNGRHRSADPALANAYKVPTAPKYIIEFLGYRAADPDPGSACIPIASKIYQLDRWPYCDIDQAHFRVTALASAGNSGETRVMLQSTYVVEN